MEKVNLQRNGGGDSAEAGAAKDEPASAVLGPGVGGDGDGVEPGAESEIWAGRTHWKHFIGRLVVWVVANIGVAVVVGMVASRTTWLTFWPAVLTVVGVFAVSGAIVVGRVFVAVVGHRYRLTTQRLFIERGILSQTIDQTELIRVDDVRVSKRFVDRLMGLGSVEILSTDVSNARIVIDGVPDPEGVAEAIRTRMRSMRRKSLFVENL